MASIKIHAIIGETQDWGFESCDYRNMADDVFPGETHRTVLERDFGPDVESNEAIEAVLRDGPAWNRQTKTITDLGLDVAGPLGAALGLVGGEIGLRIGVWDA